MTERPRLLIITDQEPRADLGYAQRVAAVHAGLERVGEVRGVWFDNHDTIDAIGAELIAGGYERVPVTPARSGRDVPTWLISPLPRAARFRRAEALPARVARAVDAGVDLIWCSRARSYEAAGGSRLGRGAGPDGADVPVVVDFVDLFDRFIDVRWADVTLPEPTQVPARLLDAVDRRRWRTLQERICAARATVVSNPGDVAHLAARGRQTTLIPNGYPNVDPRVPEPGGPFTMVFVGSLRYEPNQEAVIGLATEILPAVRRRVADARLVVVGAGADQLPASVHAPGVEFLGRLESLDDVYASADVAVAPLRFGGGTSIKVVEAFARAVPLVASTFAADGFGATAGEHLLIADDPTGFADHVISLAEDPARGVALAAAARRRFDEHHQWAVAEAKVADLVTHTLAGHPVVPLV